MKNFFIAIKSVWVTLKISLGTLFSTMFGKISREKSDTRLKWWASKLLKFADVKLTVNKPEGFELEEGRAYVLMSNHQSFYDIPLIYSAFENSSIRMITKKDLFKIPIWGRAMKAAEFISIDRNNQKQAFRDLEYAKELMQSGIRVWVAPEGGRSFDGKLKPFKRGGFKIALDLHATIIPVAIKDARKILAPGSWQFAKDIEAQINIGEPVSTKGYNMKNIKDLVVLIRESIESML